MPVRGTLTVVATPLGDPTDLSPRAAAALRAADVVVAEDTRSARRLLAGLGASDADPPTMGGANERSSTSPSDSPRPRVVLSCFDANEAARAAEVRDRLTAGENIALISEAGTPLVSDPGFRIVAAAIEIGARIIPIPGPSAVLAALVGAGLPTDRFLFLGFPPRKSGARRRLFESVRTLPATLVCYESPLRTAATLTDMAEVLGAARRACVARELTKPHEEFARDTLGALAARYGEARPLGEVTLVVAGADSDAPEEELDDDEIVARGRALIADGQSPGDAARAIATLTGRPRRDIYNLIARDQPDEKED